nr:hypothetical protein [Parafrankia sp. Ea1.12]
MVRTDSRLRPRRAAARDGQGRVRGRAEVRHYPCDHFDLHAGKPWHEPALAHQISFLRRALAPSAGRAAVAAR